MAVPACRKSPAHVPQPTVGTEINASQNLSCQSPGHSVDGCLWAHCVNGNSKVIIVDEHTIGNGEPTSVEGVSFTGDVDSLNDGDCTIQISNVTQDHLGLWSCTLITKNSTVFSGIVNLGIAKTKVIIVFIVA